MNASGIYKIQSKIKPERCYIGSAKNMRNRKWDHLYRLKKRIHHSAKLQAHYNKYGRGDLSFSVVAYCDKADLIPDEKGIIQLEQFYIDAFKSWFNMCPTAHSHLGLKYSKEVCDKMGELHKGKPVWNKGLKATAEARHNQSLGHKGKQMGKDNPFYGKKHSIKTRKIISDKMKGKAPAHIKTEKFRKKIGELKKGNTYRKGMITPYETRKKQSEAAIKRYQSKEERVKTSLSLKKYFDGLKKAI